MPLLGFPLSNWHCLLSTPLAPVPQNTRNCLTLQAKEIASTMMAEG